MRTYRIGRDTDVCLGDLGVPQDLVDWLSPTLTVSNFLAHAPNAPDIVAVGFQELLPLHFGCTSEPYFVAIRRFAILFIQFPACPNP
jgi:hypothetical protein